ncbi:hypothetical protein SAMN05660477_02976 [Soonwooa buanensis]|uniref:Uncharacterized protein n=1 Tax=Soonwooa buanensis TaxID=619805 RepID=A0A1T5GM66_9FLAO|nr:hypothetical protein [Soonwooa buanensis]SKC09477.1 hypothetical protein SAMN05660477_02976 [Soonwooa buanensis]
MNKREFIKAILRGDKDEALEIKNKIVGSSMDNYLIVVYSGSPISGDLTPDEIKRRDEFMAKTERENPNKEIKYIGSVRLKPI